MTTSLDTDARFTAETEKIKAEGAALQSQARLNNALAAEAEARTKNQSQ